MWKSGPTWTRTAIAGGALLASLIVVSIVIALGNGRPATASGASGARQANGGSAEATTSFDRRRHRKCRRGYVRRRVKHHKHRWKCVRRHTHHKKPASSPPAGTPPAGTQPSAPTGADTPGATAPSTGDGPSPSGEPPAPIASLGYHQVFRDDFNTLDRSVWDHNIWYDGTPNPNWTGFQAVDSNGILHLRTSRFFTYSGCSTNCYPIDTVTTQSSGKAFKYGYFEANMKWSAGDGAWPGFWLYSYQHAIDTNQCTTQAGEIDVMEGQGSEPNVFYGTIHSNTNGCSPADDQNGNNYQAQSVDLSQGFHTYGVLWTPTTVSWYLDGKFVMSAPTYATDNQKMFMLLQMWSGGWTKDPGASTPDTIETQVDYVDVWQP